MFSRWNGCTDPLAHTRGTRITEGDKSDGPPIDDIRGDDVCMSPCVDIYSVSFEIGLWVAEGKYVLPR